MAEEEMTQQDLIKNLEAKIDSLTNIISNVSSNYDELKSSLEKIGSSGNEVKVEEVDIEKAWVNFLN